MDKLDIIAKLRKIEFARGREEQFRSQLAADDVSKSVIDVETARDIFLSQGALLAGKFQLTTTGASQYLGVVSNGLYATVRSLIDSEHDGVDQEQLRPLIAQVVNRIIAYREKALIGYRGICCEARHQLDGFASSRYVMVSNDRVYSLFKDSCELLRYRSKFYRAELQGRDMTAVVLPQVAVPCQTNLKIHLGAICQNGETVGRAIRASVVVFDRTTKSFSVVPFCSDTRVPHVRPKKLRDKMMRMSDTLAARQKGLGGIADVFANARKKRVAKQWDSTAVRKIRAGLALIANEFHAQMHQVDQVIVRLGEVGERTPTLFDLYAACLAEADTSSMGKSLPLRQLAFKVITETP